MMKRKKGFFSISAVAKMFSVHQQTVRLYEKQGLITPKRSAGNTRLFSEGDIDRLEDIIHLTHELGINLAGVEMILKLKKQIKKMQEDMNKMFDSTQEELDKEAETSKVAVRTSAERLISMKRDQQRIAPSQANEPVIGDGAAMDADNWEVEYEDE
jgi:MerR family transcriptional regulator/heat shock protein HspR